MEKDRQELFNLISLSISSLYIAPNAVLNLSGGGGVNPLVVPFNPQVTFLHRSPAYAAVLLLHVGEHAHIII